MLFQIANAVFFAHFQPMKKWVKAFDYTFILQGVRKFDCLYLLRFPQTNLENKQRKNLGFSLSIKRYSVRLQSKCWVLFGIFVTYGNPSAVAEIQSE